MVFDMVHSNSPTSHGPSASTSPNEAITIRGMASKPEMMLRVKNVIFLEEVIYISSDLTLIPFNLVQNLLAF